MGVRKYVFKHKLKNYSREEGKAYLHKEVFSNPDFENHVNQVAVNLEVDESIVRDVLISYWTNIFYLINTVRKVKTKINVYGFFSLVVEKGDRH